MQTDHDTHSPTRNTSTLSVFGSLLIVALGGCAEGSVPPDPGLPGSGTNDPGSPGNQEPTAGGGSGAPAGTTPTGGAGGSGGQTTTPPGGGASGGPSGTGGGTLPTTCASIDWSAVGALAQSSTTNLRSLRATTTNGCLYVSVEYERNDSAYGLLLDTDGNSATGFRTDNWAESSGAEYLAQDELLYRHDSLDATAPWKSRDAKPLLPIVSARAMEFRIPLGALQNPGSIRLGFMLLGPNGSMTGQIPSANKFVLVGPSTAGAPTGGGGSTPVNPGAPPGKPVTPPDRSACRASATKAAVNTGRKIDISKGMIVPAYLSTADIRTEVWQTMEDYFFPAPFDNSGTPSVKMNGFTYGLRDTELSWVRLVQEARTTRAASLDFFVVANSASNGPPATFADWNAAIPLWTGIQSEGGGVFGYVRTSKQASGPEFVDIDQVMTQVDTWVRNYPEIDGIWLDQFRPRHELLALEGTKLSPPAGCDASVMHPSYPNGPCNAPSDTSYLRSNGCFDPAVAIDPTGGYYHTLTQRIRGEYPGLAIIANAGRRLATNQLKYGSLVDLLVSYEESFATAQSNWALVKRESSSSVPEAALLHGTRSDGMRGAIDHLTNNGYTHVYVTDQVANSTTNVWGKLPVYLSSEASYVVQKF
jgi:Spherulation-specific family 4